MTTLPQLDREHFVRLTVVSNDTLGRYLERKHQRGRRTDFTTPGFIHPEEGQQ